MGPEDEEQLKQQLLSNKKSIIWNQSTDHSSFKTSSNIDNCQLNKCNCECCFTSNSIQLSSSIVHIDENNSDDEYLDAINYTVDDLNDNESTAIKNLINSTNFNNISFNEQLNNTNYQPNNQLNNDHLDTLNDHNSDQFNNQQFNNQQFNQTKFVTSSCKSNTSTITSYSFNSQQQQQLNLIKCHCRLNTSSFAKRPLSLSSISSSSSSCSLSRNNSLALSDLKKPYLASIESLGDDELNGNNLTKYQLNDEHSSGISSGCHTNSTNSTEPSVHSTCSCCVLRSNSNLSSSSSLVRSASTNSNQSQCNNYDHQTNHHTLSQMDRVIMEIVQTETAYVKDLNEIIEGYFIFLSKQLNSLEEEHKQNDNYESDDDQEDEMTNNTLFTHLNQQSNTVLKSSIDKSTKRISKATFGNLNNQFNLDDASPFVHLITNQTSHTLPKSIKYQQNLIKSLKETSQFTINNLDHETKISHDKLVNLFGNLNDILKFNSKFLNQLIQCDFDAVQIAQCFVENADGFHVYSQYCINYPKQVETLAELNRNAYTNQLLKLRQTELCHSLPLGSYLLKPIQRILKYSLLLNNLVKHFESEQHFNQTTNQDQTDNVNQANDRQHDNQSETIDRSLRNALSVMQSIATNINTMKKKHEHAVRVQEIQSLLIGWPNDLSDLSTFGELVAENTFKLFSTKTWRHLFLFDKMLLVVKKKDDSLFTYKTHILCSNLMLIESIPNQALAFHIIPFNNPKIQFTFQAKNLDQKREWCLLIKNVILESYQAIPTHAKQIVLGLGQKNQPAEIKHHKVFPSVNLNRKLSAPEYLSQREKRCKAQQKSLSNNLPPNSSALNCSSNNHNQAYNLSLGLQFKLRKSLKKVNLIGNRNSAANILSNNKINESNNNVNINEMESIVYNKNNKIDTNQNDDNLSMKSHINEIKINQHENNLMLDSFDNSNNVDNNMETDHKLVNNHHHHHHNISSCLSSTSLTTTNDSGVGSTGCLSFNSQLRLTTPISLGSSIASIESNVTTTTANSYSTGYSQLSGSTNSKCLANNQLNDNQSSNDDFNELLNDHESNIRMNSIKSTSFRNKRCLNRCCTDNLINRYNFNRPYDVTSSIKFTDSRANGYSNSKFYRNSKYNQLNSEEIDFKPHNSQVRRVQSFTIGNKINSRLLSNYSCNKSFALNSGCKNTNSSAILQHTVSFRKSANVDLVLAKLRHLHRKPGVIAAQKQMYKQQKIQQLNEIKLQELNLTDQNDDDNLEQEKDLKLNNETELIDKQQQTDNEKKNNLLEKFIKSGNKLKGSPNSNSMEELFCPTLPAIWLKKQEQHFLNDSPSNLKNLNSLKRGNSLPSLPQNL